MCNEERNATGTGTSDDNTFVNASTVPPEMPRNISTVSTPKKKKHTKKCRKRKTCKNQDDILETPSPLKHQIKRQKLAGGQRQRREVRNDPTVKFGVFICASKKTLKFRLNLEVDLYSLKELIETETDHEIQKDCLDLYRENTLLSPNSASLKSLGIIEGSLLAAKYTTKMDECITVKFLTFQVFFKMC